MFDSPFERWQVCRGQSHAAKDRRLQRPRSDLLKYTPIYDDESSGQDYEQQLDDSQRYLVTVSQSAREIQQMTLERANVMVQESQVAHSVEYRQLFGSD